MFILKCKRDDSVCKVDDNEVIFDEDSPPKEGEDVKFHYGGKEEYGQVIMKSDNRKEINTKFEQVKQSLKKRTRRSPSSEDNNELVSTKRSRKINSKYTSSSFENLELSKLPKVRKVEKREIKDDNKKKGDKIMQSVIQKELTSKQSKAIKSKDYVSSLSKDELNKQMAKLQEAVEKSEKSAERLDDEIASTSHTSELEKKKKDNEDNSATESDSDVSLQKNNLSDCQDSSENNESHDDLKISNTDDNNKENNPQNITFNKISPGEAITKSITADCNDPDLYSKDWPEETMFKLMNRIYCKESEYKMCKSLCSQASHIVRRLITGVFKPSGYLNATLTGQAPRAHLQKGKPAPVKALNAVAKDEIIDFAMALAREKKWVTPKGVPQTREQLASIMSQRIGELKRADQVNKQAKP